VSGGGVVGRAGIGEAGPVAKGIELVVTDLDGTLWETPATTHEKTVKAVAEVLRRGYPLLVATGRRVRSTRRAIAENLDHDLPAVVLNGGLLVDLATDERLATNAFTPEAAAVVLGIFHRAGLTPCVYVDGGAIEVYTGVEPSTHPDHLRALGEWVAPADLSDIVATRPVYSFGILGMDNMEAWKLAVDLAAVSSPTVNPDRENGGVALNVGPAGISKWDGIVAYCRHTGLDPSAVLALGDASNDLTMLGMAAVALVPEDGSMTARDSADRVIPRAVDGGWAAVLDHLP
jgi:hydroxymethylpyrimidine pyrophosphatase-like HAD family hydrolase